MNLKKSTLRLAISTALLGGFAAGPVYGDAIKADFNGDGYEDLVVGVPNESIGSTRTYRAGAVKVVYGESHGVMGAASTTAYLHQTSVGVPGINLAGMAEAGDNFGAEIAVGDFNDDGYDDLAIATPGEDIVQLNNTGVLNIAYGSATGLRSLGNHLVDLRRYANGYFFRGGSRFGISLSVGDYNGDGIEDLAAGMLGAWSPYHQTGGAVLLMFGDSTVGLKDVETSGRTFVVREPWNVSTDNQFSGFGRELVSGDFNYDGFDDLAVAAPYETVRGVNKVGSVRVAFGTHDWKRRRSPALSVKIVPNVITEGGSFGLTLAAGNFSGDSWDELAIGMPNSDLSGKSKAGAVIVANFNDNGAIYQSTYYQSQNNIPGHSEKGNRFGKALTAADFNGDGYDDLAIGIPNKDTPVFIWTDTNVGEVIVLRGSYNGLDRAQRWHQDVSGVEGSREMSDEFGASLSSGDFNNDGFTDLLVGVTYEGLGSAEYTGAVQLIWGHPSAVTTVSLSDRQFFHQGSFNGPGFGADENEYRDNFGLALP